MIAWTVAVLRHRAMVQVAVPRAQNFGRAGDRRMDNRIVFRIADYDRFLRCYGNRNDRSRRFDVQNVPLDAPIVQPQPSYASQIQQLQAEHQQRIEALRNVADLPAELREQLLESEQQRFRDRLLAANENQPNNQNDP